MFTARHRSRTTIPPAVGNPARTWPAGPKAIDRFELTLEPDDRELVRARQAIRDRLDRWEVTAGADDVVLTAHELIANAARHGCSTANDVITIVMQRVDGHVLVAVYDPSSLFPVIRQPSDDAETGRGLPLVMSLCDRWGVLPAHDGKWVWLTRACVETGPMANGAGNVR